MAGKSVPTEESLGLSPTEDELNTSTSTGQGLEVQHEDDDDIPRDDDPPEPEAKPAAEAKPADAAPAAPDPAKPPQMVDVRAVQEARAAERESKQYAATLERRLNEILLAQQPKPAPVEPPPIPKWGVDPVAAGEWTQEKLIAYIEGQEKQQREAQEQAQQQRQHQELVDRANVEFRTAAAADPTLPQAYDRLRESMGNEFLAMGMTIPEARQRLDHIEAQHIAHAAKQGIPIDKYIKNLASARGWQPAAPTPAPKPAPDLGRIAEAQGRHQSLSDAPGGEAIPVMDAKMLGRMSDKEFKAWMSVKGNEQKFDQIMGRG